jgi:hypothetical protein
MSPTAKDNDTGASTNNSNNGASTDVTENTIAEKTEKIDVNEESINNSTESSATPQGQTQEQTEGLAIEENMDTSTNSNTDEGIVKPESDSEQNEAFNEPATASVAMANVQTSTSVISTTPTSKRKEKQSWTLKQEEDLMIAVLEERKIRTDKENEENVNEGDEDENDVDEEDWDVIDWDVIAESVTDRTAVECLKRYLKNKKTYEVKKAASATPPALPDPGTLNDKTSPAIPAKNSQKRASTVVQTEEMTLSPKRKKKDIPRWSDDETNLLNSLAEQYHDSKFIYILYTCFVIIFNFA